MDWLTEPALPEPTTGSVRMCHDIDSRPPAPPEPGQVLGHGRTHLASADGTRVLAYRADPEQSRGARIVLLPDIRGLHPFYEDLAVRFAEAGYPTVALDWFGRTAADDDRGADFVFQDLVPSIRPDNVRDDVAAAIASLDQDTDGPTFTVGFCLGGSHSWRLSASDLPLAGTVGFYGRPALVEDVVPAMTRPLLLLVAGADAATPPEEADRFAGLLDAASVPYERHVYDGAPHSFFDRGFAQWQDACADAWSRILAFTDRHATP